MNDCLSFFHFLNQTFVRSKLHGVFQNQPIYSAFIGGKIWELKM